MTRPPIISVIMPLYNKRPYVRRAIESVQQQTFTDWELIIVDDGSTDGSISEIPRSDRRIRLFQQDNSGPGAARNQGAKMALGELISFIDADDNYDPRKLEQERAFLINQRKAEWMISPCFSKRKGKVASHFIKDINGKDIVNSILVNNAFKSLALQGIPVDGICVKKTLLRDLGGFNVELPCFEVTEFVIRCALKQPRIFVNSDQLYYVNKVPNSAFTVKEDRLKGYRKYAESLNRLSSIYPEFSKPLKVRSRNSSFDYVRALIDLGKPADARIYLLIKAPYMFDKKWWKLLLISSLHSQAFFQRKVQKRKM